MEKILCAAIHKRGERDAAGNPLIYCGLRHCNVLWQSRLVSRNPRHQGFLTTKGRFVTRKQAAEIAIIAGQVKKENLKMDELYSEDLY